jgi:hypothetical protein
VTGCERVEGPVASLDLLGYSATVLHSYQRPRVWPGGYRFKGVPGYWAISRSADLSVWSGVPSTRGRKRGAREVGRCGEAGFGKSVGIRRLESEQRDARTECAGSIMVGGWELGRGRSVRQARGHSLEGRNARKCLSGRECFYARDMGGVSSSSKGRNKGAPTGVGQVERGPTDRGEVACRAYVELCEGKNGVTLEGVKEEGTSRCRDGARPPLAAVLNYMSPAARPCPSFPLPRLEPPHPVRLFEASPLAACISECPEWEPFEGVGRARALHTTQ